MEPMDVEILFFFSLINKSESYISVVVKFLFFDEMSKPLQKLSSTWHFSMIKSVLSKFSSSIP